MISANSYEEVYEILSLMDKLTVMKIPEETLRLINEKRNAEYKTKIDKNDIFNEQNVSKEAIDLLCYFDYHYWMDEKKKKEVDSIHKLKNQKKEEERQRRYNAEDVFKNKQDSSKNKTLNKEEIVEMIDYKGQKWYKKIFFNIKKLLKKYF